MVAVEADTDEDALSAVEKAYRNGDIVLDGSDFEYGTEEMFIEDIQDNIEKNGNKGAYCR